MPSRPRTCRAVVGVMHKYLNASRLVENESYSGRCYAKQSAINMINKSKHETNVPDRNRNDRAIGSAIESRPTRLHPARPAARNPVVDGLHVVVVGAIAAVVQVRHAPVVFTAFGFRRGAPVLA